MVAYIDNLDLFEDYPCSVEDEQYETEDLIFNSLKRYSVPQIEDIFRMSYDAEFYSMMMDPQPSINLEDTSGKDFVEIESDTESPMYDYPSEAAEVLDEDWYSPHPDLQAVVARLAGLQLHTKHGDISRGHGDVPDVPFDATTFQTPDDQDPESAIGLETLREDTEGGADVRLSMLFPFEPRRRESLDRKDLSAIDGCGPAEDA